jgi:hypothetical protein
MGPSISSGRPGRAKQSVSLAPRAAVCYVGTALSRAYVLWSYLRIVLQYALILLTFVTIFHFNLKYRPGEPVQHPARRAAMPGWQISATKAYNELMQIGRRIGVKSVWRMYSPVPTHLRKTEIYALDENGTWVEVTPPDMSLDYRAGRTMGAALLWDFKRARINDNYFNVRVLPRLPQRYLHGMRPAIVQALGWEPRAFRVVVRGAPIPPPAEKGDWRPETAEYIWTLWEDILR